MQANYNMCAQRSLSRMRVHLKAQRLFEPESLRNAAGLAAQALLSKGKEEEKEEEGEEKEKEEQQQQALAQQDKRWRRMREQGLARQPRQARELRVAVE